MREKKAKIRLSGDPGIRDWVIRRSGNPGQDFVPDNRIPGYPVIHFPIHNFHS